MQQQRADERYKAQIDKLKKELELVKQGKEKAPADEAGEEEGSKKMLKELEEQKRFYEKYDATKVEGVLAQIKALKATKAALVPVGEQLKRAEQDLAKKAKISHSIEASLAAAKLQLAELERKQKEALAKQEEAAAEVERVKTLIAAPAVQQVAGNSIPATDGPSVAEAFGLFLQGVPEAVAQELLTEPEILLLGGLRSKLPALHEKSVAHAASKAAEQVLEAQHQKQKQGDDAAQTDAQHQAPGAETPVPADGGVDGDVPMLPRELSEKQLEQLLDAKRARRAGPY